MDIKKFNFQNLQKTTKLDKVNSKEDILSKNNFENHDITLLDHIFGQNPEQDITNNPENNIKFYSEEEMADLKSISYEQGRQDGQLEIIRNYEEKQKENELETEKILRNIQGKLDELVIIDTKKLFEQNIEHMKILSVNIAKKIASYALTQNLSDVIESMVEKYIFELKSKKKLIIRLNPELASLEQILLANFSIHKDINFEIIFDKNIELYDVKIEWDNGFIHRNTKQIIDDIESLIHRL